MLDAQFIRDNLDAVKANCRNRNVTAEANKGLRKWGEPRKFDFKPKDHVALAESLKLVDFEAGSSVAGPKFFFLKGDAVLLELALIQYAMDTLMGAKYTPVITPDVA